MSNDSDDEFPSQPRQDFNSTRDLARSSSTAQDDDSFDENPSNVASQLAQSRAARREMRNSRRGTNKDSSSAGGGGLDAGGSSSAALSGSDTESRRDGRQGPRSPLRGSMSRDSGTEFESSRSLSSNKENNRNSNNNNNSSSSSSSSAGVKKDVDLALLLEAPLVTTITTPTIVPSEALYVESNLIVVPKGSITNAGEDVKVIVCQFCSKILDPFNCFNCNCNLGGYNNVTRATNADQLSEIDIIRGDASSNLFGASGIVSQQGFSANNFLGTDVVEMDYASNRDDGVYRPLVMSSLDKLLTGEIVDKPIPVAGPSVNNVPNVARANIQLSRISQRMLREEEGYRGDIAAREQVNEKFPVVDKMLPTSSPLTAALASLTVGPVFRAIEDPVDQMPQQPLLPPMEKSYGGVLGDWNPEDNANDGRGNDPDLGSFVTFSDHIDDKNRPRLLAKLHLHRLNIIDHPLFTEEERRSVQIRRLYMQYKSLLEQQNVDHYTQRILNSYSMLRAMLDNRAKGVESEYISPEQAHKKLEILYNDILESISVLADVRNMLETLTTNILEAWVQLRQLRENQKFNSSKLSVDAKRLFVGESDESGFVKQDSGVGAVLAAWRKLTNDLGSIERDLNSSFIFLYSSSHVKVDASTGSVMMVAEETKAEKKAKKKKSPDSAAAAVGQKESISSEELSQRKLDRVISEMKTLEKYSLPLPSLIIRVSESENVVNYVNDINEMRRRKIIHSQRLKVVVKVDNEIVTSSLSLPILFPSWHCEFNQHFELCLLSKPKNVALDIVLVDETAISSCLFKEETLGTVFVPMSTGKLNEYKNFGPPTVGIVTHSLTPVVGWFSFTSTKVFPDPFSPQFAAQSVFTFSDEQQLPGSPIQGAILCSVEFESSQRNQNNAHEGVHPSLVARVQGGTSKSAGGSVIEMMDNLSSSRRGNSSLNIDTVALERDFQALLPDAMLLDPNDPRNDVLLYSKLLANKTAQYGDMFQLRGMEVAHYYSEKGVDYSNFTQLQMGSRLKLLKMRNKKLMSAFSEPIPLSDKLIDANEVYKQLLTTEYESDQMAIRAIDAQLETNLDASTASPKSYQAANDDAQTASNRDDIYSKKKASFFERVRSSNIIADRISRRKPVSTTSVVHENKVYRDFEIFSLLVSLFPEEKRSLKPTINARVAQSVNVPSCDVLVQVIGAKNIPLREENEGGIGSIDRGDTRSSISRRSSSKSARLGGMDESINRVDRGEGDTGNFVAKAVLDKDMLDVMKMKERRRARTFVRVSFQENVKNTMCIEGGAPLWKQSIGLPFCPPNDDFSPANVNSVQDEVSFVLFDEFAVDLLYKNTLETDESITRVEKHFIGQYSVPITTVFRENRIEGVFRLETPLFNVGYGLNPNDTTKISNGDAAKREEEVRRALKRDDQLVGCVSLFCPSLYECTKRIDSMLTLSSPQFSSGTAWALEHSNRDLVHPDTQVEFAYYVPGPNITFIRLMLTLDPLLVKAPQVDFELSTSNTISIDKGFIIYAKSWISDLHSHSSFTKDRHYQAFVNNIDGMSVFLSRYLAPIRPPPGFDNKRSTLHLVSLVPFLSDGHAFSSNSGQSSSGNSVNADVHEDSWCSVSQTIALGSGDEEEHGCLLYNFWYYLIHYAQQVGGGNMATDSDDHRSSRSGSKPSSAQGTRKTSNYPSDEFVANESLFLVLGDAIPEGDSVYVLYRDSRRKRATGGVANASGGSNGETTAAPQSGIAAMLSSFLPTLNYATFDDAGYNPDNFLLINPCTGHMFSAADRNCPLKSIHTVATPYNIWANIQHTDMPSQMNFNVRNSVHWRPFFGSSFPYPLHGLASIQIDPEQSHNHGDMFTIPFRPSSESDAIVLENSIKTKLTSTIRQWRSKRMRSTTTFHSDASNIITVILPLLESWKKNGTVDESGDVSPRGGGGDRSDLKVVDMEAAMGLIQERLNNSMSTILKTRTLRGLPINLPYTDSASIERKVKTLCVHEVKNPEAQFVLAVRVFPLTSGLFSVWIFLGTLEPKL